MHAANLERARRAGKRLLSRAELLGRIAEEYPHVLAVAGCHGKTSATAMLAHIFSCGKRAFTCHIGGEDLDLGNYHCTGGDFLLTEACEFRRSFLRLKSEIAVVLNTDLDHTDCYRDHDDLLAAYRMFAESRIWRSSMRTTRERGAFPARFPSGCMRETSERNTCSERGNATRSR